MPEYFGAPAHLRTNAGVVSRAQARVDAIQAKYRASQASGPAVAPAVRPSIRRDPPPLTPALVPTEDELSLRLAEELEYARRLLDAMGDSLSADPGILMRHAVSLQSVDIVGQIMGHIARVIRSSDPAGAVDHIGMSDLKARLQRKTVT